MPSTNPSAYSRCHRKGGCRTTVGAPRLRGQPTSGPACAHGSAPQTRCVTSRVGAWTASTGMPCGRRGRATAADLLASPGRSTPSPRPRRSRAGRPCRRPPRRCRGTPRPWTAPTCARRARDVDASHATGGASPVASWPPLRRPSPRTAYALTRWRVPEVPPAGLRPRSGWSSPTPADDGPAVYRCDLTWLTSSLDVHLRARLPGHPRRPARRRLLHPGRPLHRRGRREAGRRRRAG